MVKFHQILTSLIRLCQIKTGLAWSCWCLYFCLKVKGLDQDQVNGETFKYSVQRYAGFTGMRQKLSSIQFRDMLVLKGWDRNFQVFSSEICWFYRDETETFKYSVQRYAGLTEIRQEFPNIPDLQPYLWDLNLINDVKD